MNVTNNRKVTTEPKEAEDRPGKVEVKLRKENNEPRKVVTELISQAEHQQSVEINEQMCNENSGHLIKRI